MSQLRPGVPWPDLTVMQELGASAFVIVLLVLTGAGGAVAALVVYIRGLVRKTVAAELEKHNRRR